MIKSKNKLSRLLPKERKILQFLSVFWEQITESEFKSLIDLMGIRTHQGQEYSTHYISILENSLVKKQLIRSSEKPWGKGIEIFDANLQEDLIREILDENLLTKAVDVIQENFPRWEVVGERYKSRILRDLRISIYQNDSETNKKLSVEIEKRGWSDDYYQLLSQIFGNPFQKEVLGRCDNETKEAVVSILVKNSLEHLETSASLWQFIDDYDIQSETIEQFKLEVLFYRGEMSEVKNSIGTTNSFHSVLANAARLLIESFLDESILQFQLAIAIWRKEKGHKNGYPNDWRIFLYALAIYTKEKPIFHQFVDEFNDYSVANIPNSSAFRAVNALDYYLKNDDFSAQQEISEIDTDNLSGKLLKCLVSSIIPTLEIPIYAEDFALESKKLGYKWVEFEVNTLIALKGRRRIHLQKAKELNEELRIESISKLLPPLQDWQRVLNTLTLAGNDTELARISRETRVTWRIDFARREIRPIEQKRKRNGWSKGRKIPLKSLTSGEVELSDQDKSVIWGSMITNAENKHYTASYYTFDWEKAVQELVGHPHLYLDQKPNPSIQLMKTEPNLIVKEVDNELELFFDIDFHREGFFIQKETETLYRVVEVSGIHVRIGDSIKNRIRIPQEGRGALSNSIQKLSSKISIQSDVQEHLKQYPTAEVDSRIYALFTQIADGFHLEFFVKPFGKIPPYFKPGNGPKSISAILDGVETRTTRSLDVERQLLYQIEEKCPSLAEAESLNYEWNLFDSEACLKAMLEMESPRNEGKLVIEWSKGQKLKLLGTLGFNNVSLNVKGVNDWFEVSGEIKINREVILSMQELISRIEETSSEFIELTDGNFLAITDTLRKHLYSLNAVVDKKQKLHKLRSGILEDFFAELKDFKVDETWNSHITKLNTAKNYIPKLPKTFKGHLREYQMEGFFWLCRLAHLGIGACLADDMGLGKTLQALAVMDLRSKIGPALVVAPVSVCRNWVNEAKRFTPELNFHIFGEGDREKMVKSLGKNDVIVTSYSLLQLEEKLFIEKDFATITLDEAQAIKNSATKRSKTVMKLKGEFRLITTGTPIENHLTELWSLFNFINPGLLGSNRFFRKKFAIPIQKDNDKLARSTLLKLIKPYILRRRKDEVLKDLPEKTEITLMVQMSEEERAFYEAIRRDAIEKIDSGDGDKRFQIFAELIRLRQASCNPRLVNPNVKIESSKLTLFGRVLEEILENEHKVLVFSQFVKHLGLVEEVLKKKKIQYHYLDGQTPANLRQKQIDAFQDGEKSVFLISLKAGGTGLNLTEADYVIHLDPWWNPAVEDQATDRVHRIGQKRPVTVYRLVTEDSVEEKIVNLHKTKRDLADSLLVETNSSSKLSVDDLLKLISGG